MSVQTDALAVCIQIGQPIILWGDPGVGKTRTIEQLAEDMDYHIETVIASLREPSDFAGLPVRMEDGTVSMAPPRWAQRCKEVIDSGGKACVFLDEFSTATPATQASALRAVQDGYIGDLHVPEIRWVAAANPPEIAAGGWDLSAPLANRFVHMNWNPDPSDWIRGMTSGFGFVKAPRIPENWEDEIGDSRVLVASFINAKTDMLHSMPKAESEMGRAWPSRRTWDYAASIHAACKAGGIDKPAMLTLLGGCIGPAAANEFITYTDQLDLPDPEVLLKDCSKYKFPARSDRTFAVLSSVVSAVSRRNTADRWKRAWQVLAVAVDQKKADIAVTMAKSLIENLPSGCSFSDLPKEAQSLVPIMREAGLLRSGR